MFNSSGEPIDPHNVEIEKVDNGRGPAYWVLRDFDTGERICSSPKGVGFVSFDRLGDAIDWVAARL